MNDTSMDALFRAFASPHRRRMLDVLKAEGGISVNTMCEHFDMSRIAVMKHLRILEEANLVVSQKEGRTRALYLNAVPIQTIVDRWTTEYSALWARKLTRIKYAVEAKETDDA